MIRGGLFDPLTQNGIELLTWLYVTELSGYRHLGIALPPLADSTHSLVSVTQLVTGYQDRIWKRPTVNWAGCGDQHPGEAQRFAEAILYAAAVAQEWAQKYTGTVAREG